MLGGGILHTGSFGNVWHFKKPIQSKEEAIPCPIPSRGRRLARCVPEGGKISSLGWTGKNREKEHQFFSQCATKGPCMDHRSLECSGASRGKSHLISMTRLSSSGQFLWPLIVVTNYVSLILHWLKKIVTSDKLLLQTVALKTESP